MTIVFVAVLVALLGSIHWYLWRRLVRDVSACGSAYRRIGTVLVIALPLALVAQRLTASLGWPFWVQQIFGWIGYLWAVTMLYLLMTLLVTEVIRPLLLRWRSRRDAEQEAKAERAEQPVTVGASPEAGRPGELPAVPGPAATPSGERGDGDTGCAPAATAHDAGRRLFVSRALALGAGAVAVSTVGYGLWNARRIRTVHATVPLVNLPAAADGYRITVMSDLHAGPVVGRSHTELVVEAMNRTEPDLMVVVGDLVDANVDELRSAIAPLGGLRATDGVYYVTGNHEYYVGAPQWVRHVRELGMTPLVNEHVRMEAGFDLAGVNDIAGEEVGDGPDMAAALDGRDPQRPVVLLAHQPEMIYEAQRHDVDLTISGHTHGGQVWPGPYIAELANPTLAGLERYGDAQLYVTRGAGAWGPPVRVGADPDIAVLTLTPAQ